MMTTINRCAASLMSITCLAIVMFCAAGTAALLGWLPTSLAGPVTTHVETDVSEETAGGDGIRTGIVASCSAPVAGVFEAGAPIWRTWPVRSVAWESNQALGRGATLSF